MYVFSFDAMTSNICKDSNNKFKDNQNWTATRRIYNSWFYSRKTGQGRLQCTGFCSCSSQRCGKDFFVSLYFFMATELYLPSALMSYFKLSQWHVTGHFDALFH